MDTLKCYTSRTYKGRYFTTKVHSYYGSDSYPHEGLYEVLYQLTSRPETTWRALRHIYTSKAAALRSARKMAYDD